MQVKQNQAKYGKVSGSSVFVCFQKNYDELTENAVSDQVLHCLHNCLLKLQGLHETVLKSQAHTGSFSQPTLRVTQAFSGCSKPFH